MKLLTRTLLALHIFIGLGAMAGGLSAILEPYEPMGMPVSALNGYFESFLIPGLFLFAALGLGNIACAALYRLKVPARTFFSGFMGAVLALWIIIQCFMLQSVVALHIIFGALGLVQCALALAALRRRG